MPPQRLGHYEIEHSLGRGAHGVVYRAYDTRLLRRVVIKTLQHRPFVGEAKRRQQMLDEARLASAIDHPNVCAVYEIGEHEGRTFLVMQYVPGRTLETILTGGRLSERAVVAIGGQIAAGLADAHGHGILHRDLKPANIMITESGLAKILDFGIAKRKPELDPNPENEPVGDEDSTAPAGTLGYMAPEQLAGRPSSRRSDIYALGVVLYQAATGRHPYSGLAGPQLIRAVQLGSRDSPERGRPSLSPGMVAVIDRAMARDPQDRFESAALLRDALKTHAASLGDDEGSVAAGVAEVRARRGRPAGTLAALARRIFGTPPPRPRVIAVHPFEVAPGLSAPAAYGQTLAEVIATRVARLPSLHVRVADGVGDEGVGDAAWIVSGRVLAEGEKTVVVWQLTDAEDGDVLSGGQLDEPTADWVKLQEATSRTIAVTLNSGAWPGRRASDGVTLTLPPEQEEIYLEGRAWLAQFGQRSRQGEHLERAREAFARVCQAQPDYAPARTALGLVHLSRVRNGFGGANDLDAARAAFEAALERDPDDVEAKLHRVAALLPLGEKETARHGIAHLIEVAPERFDVRWQAARLLRLDGLYERCEWQLSAALRSSPADAHRVYGMRARLAQYSGDLDAADAWLARALGLQPDNPTLRNALGYQRLRQGRPSEAVDVLRSILDDEPHLHATTPTLALALAANGEERRARALIDDATRAAADCDGDLAYRLASFYASIGESESALLWLRKAIYLGNENQPWFANNPIWRPLGEHPDFIAVVAALSTRWRRNRALWDHFLADSGS